MSMLEDQMIHGGWARWPGPARIEDDTPIVPHAIASAVWEEAGAWLGEELPREWLARLIERAEAVYASNARVRRRLRGNGNGGRDWLWAFTRHWLAALIWQQRPDLYTRLPDSFNVGHLLPQKLTAPKGQLGASDSHIDRLVYDLHLPVPRLRQAGGLTDQEIQSAEGATQ